MKKQRKENRGWYKIISAIFVVVLLILLILLLISLSHNAFLQFLMKHYGAETALATYTDPWFRHTRMLSCLRGDGSKQKSKSCK